MRESRCDSTAERLYFPLKFIKEVSRYILAQRKGEECFSQALRAAGDCVWVKAVAAAAIAMTLLIPVLTFRPDRTLRGSRP
jgi:hypothetical protein